MHFLEPRRPTHSLPIHNPETDTNKELHHSPRRCFAGWLIKRAGVVNSTVMPQSQTNNMASWHDSQIAMIHSLNGATVVHWSAIEMALNDTSDASALIWCHSSVPMLQLFTLHAQLLDGSFRKFSTHNDDECGILLSVEDQSTATADGMSPIFRSRNTPEIPCGKIMSVQLTQNRRGNVVTIDLQINSRNIKLFSGEVYERHGAAFEVVLEDESVLVQVDGQRPQVA